MGTVKSTRDKKYQKRSIDNIDFNPPITPTKII